MLNVVLKLNVGCREGKCIPVRLKLFDFTAMDHTAGMSDMFMPTAPATSVAHASSNNSALEGMMTMQMWFQATTKVTLWFKEWSIDSNGK